MSKTVVQASLNIELDVICPHCDGWFDLFELDGGYLNEDADLINRVCPSEHWGDAHKNYSETVNCPHCDAELHIQGIFY